MKRLLLGLLIAAGLNPQLHAQDQPSLNTYTRVQIDGVSDTDLFLAYYYGNKLYYADTARTDAKGLAEFKGRPFDEQGKYAVVIPGKPYFDIIIGNEPVSIQTDTTDLVGNLQVHEGWNNTAFYSYVKFINDMRGLRAPHDSVLKDSLATEKMQLKSRKALKKLNDEVLERQHSIVDENPDKLFAKYMLMMLDVQVPEDIGKGLDDEEKRVERYQWYKAHYWDNVDLTDNRMVRDQAFHNTIERYVEKVLPQIPDSLTVEAQRFISRVEGKADLYKYAVHHFTWYAETSKMMCMDKAFVALVDTYYATDKCPWMDQTKLDKILAAAETKRGTLCDKTFPDIRLKDKDGVWWGVLDTDTKYTVVVVWESSCGHCKKEMPVLREFYNNHKDLVSVYSIGNDYEREPWLEFIKKHELEDFINVSDDPEISNDNPALVREALMCCTNLESLNFRKTLDINSTPKIWLLDENHQILAKQMNSEQLEDLLQSLEKNDAENTEDGTGAKDAPDSGEK